MSSIDSRALKSLYYNFLIGLTAFDEYCDFNNHTVGYVKLSRLGCTPPIFRRR